MNRVVSYVDGFNFYYGLKDKCWQKFYWLDFAAVTRSLLKPGQEFQHCHYFTARVRKGGGSQNNLRQDTWLDALAAQKDISCHYGHFLSKQQSCRRCGAVWNKSEEKMTDVNIATQLLLDAYENVYDTAIIMSGDSDLSMPVQKIREKFPQKRIIVAFPPARYSSELKRLAHGHITIGADKLRQNLLPEQIRTESGFILHRPSEWY